MERLQRGAWRAAAIRPGSMAEVASQGRRRPPSRCSHGRSAVAPVALRIAAPSPCRLSGMLSSLGVGGAVSCPEQSEPASLGRRGHIWSLKRVRVGSGPVAPGSPGASPPPACHTRRRPRLPWVLAGMAVSGVPSPVPGPSTGTGMLLAASGSFGVVLGLVGAAAGRRLHLGRGMGLGAGAADASGGWRFGLLRFPA